MRFYRSLQMPSPGWVSLCLLLSFSGSVTSAGQADQNKAEASSLKKIVKRCASVGFILACGRVPSAEAGQWVAGTALDCESVDAISDQGLTSVVCLQYGPMDHGVSCTLVSRASSGPYDGVICSKIDTPDEHSTRYCTQTSYDTIGQDAGVICDQYGSDFSATYCMASAIAQSGGYENVMCSRVYCPSCLHYVPDPSSGSCFPDKTWLKVKASDGTVQAKAMREIRIGDWVEVGQESNGSQIFSKIVDVPHRQPGKKSVFLQVMHRDSAFLISPEHLVYVAHAMGEVFDQKTAQTKFAKDLVAGDLLWTQAGATLSIDTTPQEVSERGLYAPETEAGTLVVYGDPEASQGTVVSCYSTFKDPAVTQALFKIRRTMFPPAPVDAATVRGSGRWDDVWLGAAQVFYPLGFVTQPQPVEDVPEGVDSTQYKSLRGRHHDEL